MRGHGWNEVKKNEQLGREGVSRGWESVELEGEGRGQTNCKEPPFTFSFISKVSVNPILRD